LGLERERDSPLNVTLKETGSNFQVIITRRRAPEAIGFLAFNPFL